MKRKQPKPVRAKCERAGHSRCSHIYATHVCTGYPGEDMPPLNLCKLHAQGHSLSMGHLVAPLPKQRKRARRKVK